MTTTLLSWQRRSFEAWLHKVCVSWFVHFNRKRPVLAVLFISLQLFNQFMTEDKLPSLKTRFSETHNKPLKTQVFWELSRWSLSDLTCNVEARRFPSTSNHFDQDPVEWISMTENTLLQRVLLPNPLLSEKTTFVVYYLLHLDTKKTILQPPKAK